MAITGAIATLVAGVMAGPAHANAWSDQVVNGHNTARAQYAAPDLTWSEDLYPDSLSWAEQCKFEHSEYSGKYGENLFATGDLTAGIDEALAMWMAEAAEYDYDNPGFSPETGHFTQVVWKNTTQVTAAVADCAPGTIFPQASKFVVARYTPGGNVIGQFPENVARPVK